MLRTWVLFLFLITLQEFSQITIPKLLCSQRMWPQHFKAQGSGRSTQRTENIVVCGYFKNVLFKSFTSIHLFTSVLFQTRTEKADFFFFHKTEIFENILTNCSMQWKKQKYLSHGFLFQNAKFLAQDTSTVYPFCVCVCVCMCVIHWNLQKIIALSNKIPVYHRSLHNKNICKYQLIPHVKQYNYSVNQLQIQLR